MTRIAIPEMEDSLLNVARHGTAAHMQRLVRKYRRVERLEAAAEAAEQYRRRYVRYRHEDDGMVVIEARLPVEIGEVVLKAIDAGVEVLYQDGMRKKRANDAVDADPSRSSDVPAGADMLADEADGPAGADEAKPVELKSRVPAGTMARDDIGHADAVGGSAAGDPAEGSCAGVAFDAPEDETDVRAGTEAPLDRCALLSMSGRDTVREKRMTAAQSWADEVREWMKAQKDLLDELRDEEDSGDADSAGEHPGDHSSDSVLLSRAELPAKSWREVLSDSEHDQTDVPARTDLALGCGDSCASGGAHEAVASRPWEPHEMPGGNAVIEEFEGQSWQASLGARRADALRLLAESFLGSGAGRLDTSADRYQVVVHVDQALLAGGTTASGRRDDDKLGASESLFRTCELDDGRALAIEMARRLACDASLVGLVEGENGDPLNVGRKTRAIPPALARAVRARDGGCRFPGCGRTRFIQGHHVIHWADGGETKLSNILSLCTFHHGLLHEGGFSVRCTPDGGFEFFAPNGERLPETGRLDRETIDALTDAAERGRVTLIERNRERGLEIDETTARCLWAGERMDYHMTVGGLIWTRDRAPV